MKFISIFIVLLLFQYTSANLYNETDSLTILTNENFNNEVFNKENAWVIHFYLTYCAHCQRFVPDWKEFAAGIVEWNHTIKVGVIDCAGPGNRAVCNHYNVTNYPHIRVYSSNVNENTFGEPVHSREVDKLTMEIIEFLVSQQLHKNSASSWVPLLPFNGTLSNLVKNKALHSVVIIDLQEMNEGTLTVMDLGNYPQVFVRTMLPAAARSMRLKYTSVPAMIAVGKDRKQQKMNPKDNTREEYTNEIFDHFNIERNVVVQYNDPVKVLRNDSSPTTNNVVYIVDMENAISFALRTEVLLHTVISGENLTALKNFIYILAKYFPGNKQTNNFLSKLDRFVNKQNESMEANVLEKSIKELESDDAHLPEMRDYVGCKGSEVKYRGYNCGLWTLFHSLTVSAVNRDGNNASYYPQEVLAGIHGYVKFFFGCEDCSEHFQKMYAEDAKRFVQKPNDEIIWLWRAHNKVNKRLTGDVTEDPMHPKIQFPNVEACAQCFDWKKSYNESSVVEYLKKIYGTENISFQGARFSSITSAASVMTKLYFAAFINISVAFFTNFYWF